MGVECSTHGTDEENAYKILAGKPEGNKSLGRTRCKWEKRWGFVSWIHLAQDRDRWRDLVNMVMNILLP